MTNKKNRKVCMLSFQHDLLDDRIYKKEALTLSQNGYEVIHIGYGNEFKDYITPDDIRIIQLKRYRMNEGFKSKLLTLKQSFMNDIFQMAKDVSADIYHLHDVELCRIALKLKKLPHHPKVIYDAHEPYLENLKDYWHKRSWFKIILNDIPSISAEKRILRKVDHLIATEENVASRFRKNNPNTSIIYNYSFFYPNESSLSEEKEYDAIYCGGISESKGIFLILEAIINCKKKGYEIKTIMVGQFSSLEIKSKVEKIIEKEKLHDNITFTGNIPIEDIANYYKRSKIGLCLFPLNRTNQLILPIKLFEYMSFGLPVVGSNFGHIKEIIEKDGAGIYVDPHDYESIASAILELLCNDSYKKRGAEIMSLTRQRYIWEKEESKLLEIYSNFIHA